MDDLDSELRRVIRDIRDYPTKGIVFKDLTPLWKDSAAMKMATDALYDYAKGLKPDKIVGIEARGFIVGAPLADRLGVGFVPARKVGKLPAVKVRKDYALEYGQQSLEMHSDAIEKGERVLIVDDLLATGGTSLAATSLVERLGGEVVGLAFIVELSFLNGRKQLAGYEVLSLVKYGQE
jgi:adenine phosphoribosyltransferase